MFERYELKEDGSHCFKMRIISEPAPCLVQWSEGLRRKIDMNDTEYQGTSNASPYPMLVVKNKKLFESNDFQIQVDNVIGSTSKNISGIFKGFVIAHLNRRF